MTRTSSSFVFGILLTLSTSLCSIAAYLSRSCAGFSVSISSQKFARNWLSNLYYVLMLTLLTWLSRRRSTNIFGFPFLSIPPFSPYPSTYTGLGFLPLPA
jgi:hypothetical protein